MIRVMLQSKVPDADVEARYGTQATDADYDVLLTGDACVYRPDGQVLCVLRRGAMDPGYAERAYPHLHWLRSRKSDNRGVYAGQADRIQRVLGDGTVSRTTRSRPVSSCVIGYFNRYPRIPFCRQTAFTANHVDKWAEVLPLVPDA